VGTSRRILLVEDSEDTRTLLALALGNDGWQVEQAADAFEGADRLRRERYDLLIADYDLPGRTGAEMIQEAFDAGVLADTRTVVITAHPEPHGVGNLDVFRKPLDLPAFLEQMRRLCSVGAPAERRADGATLELVLYVSTHSLASARALEALRALVPDSTPDVRLTVCDLTAHPQDGEADNVVFTPTLVKQQPAPRTWILGDLTRTETLDELLRRFRTARTT
jgi:CheY-like chemotaxis protein